jgi:four helix bundle protein
MPFKFEKLEVWRKALDYIQLIDAIAIALPPSEAYNLRSQMTRAATSVALNIAEGSIGQTDAEQARFVGMAIRSLVETVACQHIIIRRKLLVEVEQLRVAYTAAEELVAMLHTLRKRLVPNETWLREEHEEYSVDPPF